MRLKQTKYTLQKTVKIAGKYVLKSPNKTLFNVKFSRFTCFFRS